MGVVGFKVYRPERNCASNACLNLHLSHRCTQRLVFSARWPSLSLALTLRLTLRLILTVVQTLPLPLTLTPTLTLTLS